ncbi:hypothetical protein DFH28DRAFT_1125551 [Melampsora americana]|nr:hypothetical protein DFH28DRAFT_1125551 [Melampsora americana]
MIDYAIPEVIVVRSRFTCLDIRRFVEYKCRASRYSKIEVSSRQPRNSISTSSFMSNTSILQVFNSKPIVSITLLMSLFDPLGFG